MKLRKLLVGSGMMLIGGLAHAQLAITGSTAASWSGYNGQPAAQTGILSSGVKGTLSALNGGTASFTFLGQESGYVNRFNFAVGSQVLTEANAVGTTISGLIGPGSVQFSFTDTNHSNTFSNGSGNIAFVANRATTSLGSFAYIIGFNDSFTGDGDYDDFVVGVNFAVTPLAPVPEPETYAMMLAGLGLLVIAGRRRKQKNAAT